MTKPKKSKKIKKQSGPSPKARQKTVEKLPNWLSDRRWHGLFLFLFGFLLYANTLGHEFAQDDAIVLYENAYVKQGVSGIPAIFKYDTFYGFFQKEGKAKLVAGGRYRPFTLIMFAFEVQLFGVNPVVAHLINALLNGLLGLLIYRLILLLLSPGKRAGQTYFIALATALLFIAHPIHTEAAANIKGRDEIMTLLASLGALYYSILAVRQSKPLLHILAGTIFFIGLLSKENAITFLAVVPLTYYFFTSLKPQKIALATTPFIIAAGLFMVIRTSVLGVDFGAPTMEMMNNPFVKVVDNQYLPFTAGEKAATITYSLGKYLQLLIFPHPLTHDYYPRALGVMQWSDWRVLLSLFAYLGLIVYAIKGFLKKDLIAYGVIFYLTTLSIVSNIFFPIGTHMAERLVFMPSLGFCFVLAALTYRLSKRSKRPGYKALYPAMIATGLLVFAFSIRTIARNTVWKNNYALFTNDIRYSPNSAKLRNAVGGELISQYATSPAPQRDAGMLQEAEGHLLEAIKIHPNYKNAYLLLGNCNYYQKEYAASAQYYRNALGIDPNYQEANDNLLISLRDGGQYFGEELGDLDKALNFLQQAYQMNPNDFETNRLLGVANGVRGNSVKAISYFEKAVALKPDDAGTWLNLSRAFANAGQGDRSQQAQQKALELNPNILNERGGN